MLQRKINSLTEQLQDAPVLQVDKLTIDGKVVHIAKIPQLIQALRAEIQELKDNLSVMREEGESFDLQLIQTQSALSRLSEENDSLESKIKAQETTIEQLKATISKLKEDLSSKKRKLDSEIETSSELKSEV